METGFVKMAASTWLPLFYKDELHLTEKGYLKLALPIKRKISLFQKIF